MSGDIGRGATRESIAFALHLAATQERPDGLCKFFYAVSVFNFALGIWLLHHFLDIAGFLQLAGGTNAHTVDGLKKVGLFQTSSFFSSMIATLVVLHLFFHFSCFSLSYNLSCFSKVTLVMKN